MNSTDENAVFSPISESALELRVDPEMSWPEGVEPKDVGVLLDSFGEAGKLLAVYRNVRQGHRSDKRLSPAGAHLACKAWIEERLPDLIKRLETVRGEGAKIEAALSKSLMGDLVEPFEAPADIAIAQEIRTWLRSMPDESARKDQVRQLVEKGDRTMLRAILTAPSYLTGFGEGDLAEFRDDAAKVASPEQYAKAAQIRKAAEAAERAVEGVVRLLHHEAEHPPITPVLPQARPPERPKPHIANTSPESQKRIAEAFRAAEAAQEAQRAGDRAEGPRAA